ncbi:MAG: HAD family hydrolase [Candidatus Hadarchaeales archaeon]
MKIRGVLFDVDSTLVDSRLAMDLALETIVRELVDFAGRTEDLEKALWKSRQIDLEMHANLQYDRKMWWRRICDELWPGVTLPGDLVENLTLEYWRIVCEKSTLFPDSLETIGSLKNRGYRLGIVTDTDGTPSVKRWRLEKLEIKKWFDIVVIAGEDTPAVKPDPGPFLLAAAKLKLKPEECLMVGDKIATDVRGAKAAGMLAALVRRRESENCAEADFVLECLGDLLRFL